MGIAYIVVGQFYWLDWMTQYDLKMQAVWMLVMLTFGPLLLGLFSILVKKLINYPICPACGKKIYKLNPTLASKRCTHCYSLIIDDERALAVGYTPPLTQKEALEKKKGYTLGANTEFLRSVRVLIVIPPLIIGFMLLLNLRRQMELEPMMKAMVIIIGAGIIGISGISPLISVAWLEKVWRFFQLIPKEKYIYCPECNSIPEGNFAKLSGCCSECGAKIIDLFIDNKADTPEMLDWHAIKRYWSWHFYGIFFLLFCGYIACLISARFGMWWIFMIFAIIYVLWLIKNLQLKKQARIPKKCPHCATHLIDRDTWSLLHYGRCPYCYHKLVRDEELEKEAKL